MSSESRSPAPTPLGERADSIVGGNRPALVRASVCAGGLTTTYLRTGTGPLVVVLGARFYDAATDPTIGVVADRHRVVIPDLQSVRSDDGPPAVDFSEWLCAFLDGLGADDVVLVASEDVAPDAIAFARSDSDRVRRVVLETRVDTDGDERTRCVDVDTFPPRADPADADQLRRPRTGGGSGQ
jgi:pimeloyl-ACP methyl ester carboxylesterase